MDYSNGLGLITQLHGLFQWTRFDYTITWTIPMEYGLGLITRLHGLFQWTWFDYTITWTIPMD